MCLPPNQARARVKSVESIFVNDQIFDLTHFDEVSRYFQWCKNEFSHSLALQPTVLARCNLITRAAIRSLALFSTVAELER